MPVPDLQTIFPTYRFGVIYMPLERVQSILPNLSGKINEIALRFKTGTPLVRMDDITEELALFIDPSNSHLEPIMSRDTQPSHLE